MVVGGSWRLRDGQLEVSRGSHRKFIFGRVGNFHRRVRDAWCPHLERQRRVNRGETAFGSIVEFWPSRKFSVYGFEMHGGGSQSVRYR